MSEWKEWEHPRDSRGRFIRKGVHVTLSGGLIGRVLGVSPDGRGGAYVNVRTPDGRDTVVPSDRITVAQPPTGSTYVADGTTVRVGDRVRSELDTDPVPVRGTVMSVADDGSIAVRQDDGLVVAKIDPSSLVPDAGGDERLQRIRPTQEASAWQRGLESRRTAGTPEERIRRSIPGAQVDLGALRAQDRVLVADAVEDATNVVPNLRSRVRAIRVNREPGPNTYADFNMGTGVLRVNETHFGSRKATKTNKNIEYESYTGFKVPSGGRPGLYQTVIHELGHGSLRPVSGVFGRDDYDHAAYGVGAIPHNVKGNVPAAHALSAYGATSHHETIAESFAEFVANGPAARPVARHVVDSLLKTHGSSTDRVLARLGEPDRPVTVPRGEVNQPRGVPRPRLQPVTGGPTAADGRPLVVGDRVTVNGRTGTITSVRPGTRVAIYTEDGTGDRRSAKIDRFHHVEDGGAPAPERPPEVEPPAPRPEPKTGDVAVGDRITVNGFTGRVTSVRPNTGIVMYRDDDGRMRSAKVDRVRRVNAETPGTAEAIENPISDPGETIARSVAQQREVDVGSLIAAPGEDVYGEVISLKDGVVQVKTDRGDTVRMSVDDVRYAGKIREGMQLMEDDDREWLREAGVVLPPAWRNVQVTKDRDAALLVVGQDAKGRSQYVYSAEHTANQAAKKFERVKQLANRVDELDARVVDDARDDDSAAAVLLMRRMGLRPGSDTDTGAEKEARGATNLRVEDVHLDEDENVSLKFTGKKGVSIDLPVNDPEVGALLRERVQGRDPAERLFNTDERRAANYFKKYAPDFKLKDLRTLVANELALEHVKNEPAPTNASEFKQARNRVGDLVSQALGNTRTVALESYVNPAVFSSWEAGVA